MCQPHRPVWRIDAGEPGTPGAISAVSVGRNQGERPLQLRNLLTAHAAGTSAAATRSPFMDRMQDGNRKKPRRLAVTERLRKFYKELLANVLPIAMTSVVA